MNCDEKHSLDALENQTRKQNSSDTTRKSLIFPRTLRFFEKHSVRYKSRYSKTNNKLCAPSHLVRSGMKPTDRNPVTGTVISVLDSKTNMF